MMKISATNDVLMDRFGDHRALEIMAEAGFDCVDYNFCAKFRGPDVNAMKFEGWMFRPKEELYAFYRELKQFADGLGIGFGQSHSPIPSLVANHPETDATMIEVATRCIEINAILDCPYIVIHPVHGYNVPLEHWFEVNMEYFGKLAPVAKANGVGICLENMFLTYTYQRGAFKHLPSILATPEDTIRYIDTLNERYGEVFSYCYDVGHGNICCSDHADFVRKLGSRLTTLHIHDNDAFDDYHLIPHLGNVKWDGFCNALKEVGYKGTFNLEADSFIAKFPPEASLEVKKLEYKVARTMVERYGL